MKSSMQKSMLYPQANEVDAFSTSAKDIYEIGKEATFKLAAGESSVDGMWVLFISAHEFCANCYYNRGIECTVLVLV